jgi:hypothetical protein
VKRLKGNRIERKIRETMVRDNEGERRERERERLRERDIS